MARHASRSSARARRRRCCAKAPERSSRARSPRTARSARRRSSEARRAVRAAVARCDAEPPDAMSFSFADLGTGALRAALPLAIWGIGAAAYAAAKRDGRALASARWSALITFLLVVLAAFAMIGALVTHDFSIAYVARNNALETPLFFTVVSLWAALEGSILLWTE